MIELSVNETFLNTFKNYGGNLEEVQRSLSLDIGHAVYEEIQDRVRGGFSPETATKYLAALKPPEERGGEVVIQLRDDTEHGNFPIWLERGIGPHAMYQLGGHTIIPFKHGKVAPTPTMPRGIRPERFPLQLLPEKKQEAARAGLAFRQRDPHHMTMRRLIQQRLRLPHHVRKDIRSGRQVDLAGATGGVTFRTKPAKDPMAWWHPGLTGRHFLPKSLRSAEKEISRIVRSYLTVFGRG